jgi:MoaA/NifB/PqqE/SkfB family radical SAM enzyme
VTSYHCPEPYEHLEIVPGGDVHVCCSGWVKRPVGNILQQSLLSIWRGLPMREVRATIKQGTFARCGACPFLPAPSGPVTLDDGPLPEVPQRVPLLTLAYERTCNLSCPSCRTEIFKADLEHRRQASLIAEVLSSRGDLDHVDRLVVTGSGDPFASPHYRDLLRDLDWQRYAHLRVRLFTNLQLASYEGWSKLVVPYWAIDELSVSVDAATEKTYAANRLYGSPGLTKLSRLELTFTAQANNFREMPEFVSLALSHGADVVYFAKLRNWGTYTPWDYTMRAVHLPTHPEHAEFLRVLADPGLAHPSVVLQNFRGGRE